MPTKSFIIIAMIYAQHILYLRSLFMSLYQTIFYSKAPFSLVYSIKYFTWHFRILELSPVPVFEFFCPSNLQQKSHCFFLNWPIPASFCLFFSFLVTISIKQIEKSVDCVLGIQTRGRMMVGTNETMELWRPQESHYLKSINSNHRTNCFFSY